MNVVVGAGVILSTSVCGYLSWWIYRDAKQRGKDAWQWFTRVTIAGLLLNIIGAAAVGLAWFILRDG